MKSSLLRLSPLALALLGGCHTLHNAPKAAPAPNTTAAPAAVATTLPATTTAVNPAPAVPTSSTTAVTAAKVAKSETVATQGLETQTLHFDYDDAHVHDFDKEKVLAAAKYLKAHPNARITIEGHCDERGSAEYNLALGERRAKAVTTLLKMHGVHASQLSVASYGKEKPVDPAHDEAAWAKNRRAVVLSIQH